MTPPSASLWRRGTWSGPPSGPRGSSSTSSADIPGCSAGPSPSAPGQAGEGDAPDRLTVVFEVRGEGTAWLAGRREGQSLDVMGLLGNGFPMKREGRYLLVGGGIGVPPCWVAPSMPPGRCTAHPGVPLRGQGDAGGAVPLRVLPGAGGHR